MAEMTADEEALFESLSTPNARALALAGVDCFAAKGFHGTTTRDIAGRVGLSPAALYVHFSSKEELLFTICKLGHEGALLALEDAIGTDLTPAERVEGMVSRFATWHARNHRLAKVVQYELGALSPERRPELSVMRQQFRSLIERAIAEGAATRAFTAPDVSGVTLAILSLCVDVARWYSPEGPRPPDDIGRLYADLIIRMLD
ncbi:MAG TPA: TetR/AcrR family transcriptional regulator [Solirubrobacterales bacterium]|nr:TetR/AcrR family transcriptional regulator [Solirubrobacterales bacterium]